MDGCQLQRGEGDSPLCLARICSSPSSPPSSLCSPGSPSTALHHPATHLHSPHHGVSEGPWEHSPVPQRFGCPPRAFQTSLSREHFSLSLCYGSVSAVEMREVQVHDYDHQECTVDGGTASAHLARGHHSLAEGLPGLPAVAGARGVGTEEVRSPSAMLGASGALHSPQIMA